MSLLSPDRLDLELMARSPLTLFRSRQIWDTAMRWFREFGYHVYYLNCSDWRNGDDMHTALAGSMQFPDYYGRNLNATLDCLRDLELPGESGGLVALDHLDQFIRLERMAAEGLVDVLVFAAWEHLVAGKRLIVLAQSDDPVLALPNLGARPALWNPQEWVDKDRGA